MKAKDYKKRDYKRGPRRRKFDSDKHCGYPANDGNPCTNAKGYATDHKGEGPCKFHAGFYARPGKSVYALIQHAATAETLEKVRAHGGDPMDLLPEIDLLRAMVIEFHERYSEFKDGIIAFERSFTEAINTLLAYNDVDKWAKAIAMLRAAVQIRPAQVIDVTYASVIVDRVGKMAERIHKMKSEAGLTPESIRAYRDALVLAVMEECTPEQARKIADKLEKL